MGLLDDYKAGKLPGHIIVPKGWRPAEFSYDPTRRERAKRSLEALRAQEMAITGRNTIRWDDIGTWDLPPKGGKTMEQEIRDKVLEVLDKCTHKAYRTLETAIREGNCMDVIIPILQTMKAYEKGCTFKSMLKGVKFSREELELLDSHLGIELMSWLRLEVKPITPLEVYEGIRKHFKYHVVNRNSITNDYYEPSRLRKHIIEDIDKIIAGSMRFFTE